MKNKLSEITVHKIHIQTSGMLQHIGNKQSKIYLLYTKTHHRSCNMYANFV